MKHWTAAQIAKTKQKVKLRLDSISADPTSQPRLKEALKQIADRQDDLSPEASLDSFVFIMSVLVQHQKNPLISPSQENNLVERAHSLLQLQGIKPGISHHSTLYGELHQVQSLIYRRRGDPWNATWEQQLGAYFCRNNPLGGQGFQSLALGNRLLRLGHGSQARVHFEKALSNELGVYQMESAQIGYLRSLRLSGDLSSAKSFLSSRGQGHASATLSLELQWESYCLEAQEHHNLEPMMGAVRKGEPHYSASYLVEAYLWTLCMPTKIWTPYLPKMRTVARKPNMHTKQLGTFFTSARQLEECYDSSIPLTLRLRKLGKTLSDARSLLNIDKEMFVWMAAARWLVRIHSFDLAGICKKEYESLSMKLTDGQNNDSLNLGSGMK